MAGAAADGPIADRDKQRNRAGPREIRKRRRTTSDMEVLLSDGMESVRVACPTTIRRSGETPDDVVPHSPIPTKISS
ncbi:MAG: hypothetical protein AMXMBFR67_07700 [Nitrospira sp.]